MKKMINNIRRQPEEVRMHILHILTGAFAVILALLWIYSLGTNLTNSDTQAKIGQDLKPFSALKEDMVGGYNSISQPGASTGVDAISDTSTDSNTVDTSSDSSDLTTSNTDSDSTVDSNTDSGTTDQNIDPNVAPNTDPNSDLRNQENNL
jgi:cytoskeletal protein RodZ